MAQALGIVHVLISSKTTNTDCRSKPTNAWRQFLPVRTRLPFFVGVWSLFSFSTYLNDEVILAFGAEFPENPGQVAFYGSLLQSQFVSNFLI